MSLESPKHKKNALTSWLSKSPDIVFVLYAVIAAFCTYSCMYAFRKPFTVATFEDLEYWGVSYKILLISAQVVGYTLSKFIGIKIVSEMGRKRRGPAIVFFILMAGISLLLFALVPAPWNIIFLFLNGLPLGMVWGLVFAYLEGRRYTEFLGAGLCVTFILSSGFVKSVGKYTMQYWGVSEFWMPVLTGMIFAIPLIIFVTLLDQLPEPDERDIALRTERKPMNKAERGAFMKEFGSGMVVLIILYAFLTAFRDFRDNFAAELWDALGYGNAPAIFTTAEIPIAIGVLVIMGFLMFIKNNMRALQVNLLLISFGGLTVGLATLGHQLGIVNGLVWMILAGFGSYLGYIPFNAILFERMIAAFRYVSNVGFAIYLADAFGYLSSVGLLFVKNFGTPDLSWLTFFTRLCYATSFGVTILGLISLWFFNRKYKHWNLNERTNPNRIS